MDDTGTIAVLFERMKSLVNEANDLAAAGRVEEALRAVREAVTINRTLAENDRQFLDHLARSLNNLAIRQMEAGQVEEALGAAGEAVTINRTLADGDPGLLNDLAVSLTNLAIALAEAGRDQEALAADTEAVEIRRELVRHDSEYLPDLSLSLNNLSERLGAHDRDDEALSTVAEAVAILDPVKDRPEVLPDYALALGNLAMRLTDAGHLDDALIIQGRSVAAYRMLAEDDPGSYLSRLVTSYERLGSLLVQCNLFRDAVRPIAEGMVLSDRLPPADRNLAGTKLAICLHRAYRGDPIAVSRAFREIFAQDIPEWIKQPFDEWIPVYQWLRDRL